MFIVGIGSVSAESIDEIGISSSDDVTDDIVAVSDDVAVDDVVAEVDSADEPIAASNNEILESVDDSGNESLAVQDVEQVDDVDDTTLTALNENESDVNDANSTLTAENDNGQTLTDLKEKTIPAGDLSTSSFNEGSNVIYYLDGHCYVRNTSPSIGGEIEWDDDDENIISWDLCENITIKPKESSNATIEFVRTQRPRRMFIEAAINVTLENIKFTGNTDSFLTICNGVQNLTIKGCIFENITSGGTSAPIVELYNDGPTALETKNIIFENCKFVNCTAGYIFLLGGDECKGIVDSISLVNCVFENCIPTLNRASTITITSAKNVHLENNTFDNNVPIVFDSNYDGTVDDSITLKVITESLSVNAPNDIYVELVDDNGNHIYSPNLKFIINDEEKTPSFDKNTGLYSISYVPTESQVSVRAVCSNVEYLDAETVYLPVKTSSDLSIDSTQSITYGEELIIVNATLNETITNENVTFTLKDSSGNVIKSVDALITNGFANSSFVEKLLPGTYTISAIYAGNEEFGESSVSAQLTVNKISGYINVTVNNATVFDDVLVTFTMPEEVSGSFELIKIGNSNTNSVAFRENVNVVDGKVTINFGPLAARDDYCIMYSFNSQNALYSSINNHGYWLSNRNLLPQFKVLKVDSIPIIDVNDICLGDNATISVSGLAETATGTVTYYVDDGEAVVKNIGETFTVEGLGVGEHNVRVVYSGDANYSANETSATFNVFTIALESYDLDYDENVAVVAVLPDGAEGMLGIEVDGIDPVSAQVVNGSAAFELSGLKPGNYTLHMTYQGTPIDLHADVDVTVIPKITNVDDLNTVDNAIGIDLPSDATGSLTVTVDGNTTIVVPVENGTAKCSIENLTAGDHEITVAYEGNYPSYSSTQTVSVAKGTPQTSVDAPSSITAGQSVTVPINLPSDATGVVLVDVDGKKYYADVIDGVANVNVAGLSAGDKVLAYRYLGDDKYAEISGSATLKVVAPKVAPKVADKISLALKKVTVKKSAKKLVIKATLKINGKAVKGKKVTFKFKGKKYTAKTNAKGIAKITVKKAVLKKLKVGKKVKYTATYGKKTAKKTVKVKK